MTEKLTKVWSLTDDELNVDATDTNTFFDSIGLILHSWDYSFDYWCTPTNSVTFASTGGDGVHYGLLDIGEGFSDSSPVVMTVPMGDAPNTIVGANLLEFLALGCRQGYFFLEQLVYQREDEVAALDSGSFEEESGESQIQLLTSISHLFNLEPWADHGARLKSLEDEISHLIVTDVELD